MSTVTTLLDRQDIKIRAGSTEVFVIAVVDDTGTPVDCTGATLKMQVRANAGKTAALLGTAVCSWQSVSGGIGIAEFSASETSAMGSVGAVSSDVRKCAYDVVVEFSASNRVRIANGFAYVSPEVTV